jgi:hypothetical protein
VGVGLTVNQLRGYGLTAILAKRTQHH